MSRGVSSRSPPSHSSWLRTASIVYASVFPDKGLHAICSGEGFDSSPRPLPLFCVGWGQVRDPRVDGRLRLPVRRSEPSSSLGGGWARRAVQDLGSAAAPSTSEAAGSRAGAPGRGKEAPVGGGRGGGSAPTRRRWLRCGGRGFAEPRPVHCSRGETPARGRTKSDPPPLHGLKIRRLPRVPGPHDGCKTGRET